jgi:hypothetical protein
MHASERREDCRICLVDVRTGQRTPASPSHPPIRDGEDDSHKLSSARVLSVLPFSYTLTNTLCAPSTSSSTGISWKKHGRTSSLFQKFAAINTVLFARASSAYRACCQLRMLHSGRACGA